MKDAVGILVPDVSALAMGPRRLGAYGTRQTAAFHRKAILVAVSAEDGVASLKQIEGRRGESISFIESGECHFNLIDEVILAQQQEKKKQRTFSIALGSKRSGQHNRSGTLVAAVRHICRS